LKKTDRIKSSKEKDIDSFKLLYDKYYDGIRNFLYYKSGDVEISEDLTQEVFLKLWGNRKNIRKETVQAYLYTIASNLLKNHFKRNRISFNFINSSLSDSGPDSPEFLMEMKEFDREIQDVLAAMPEKSRVVFLMNRIDGVIYRDIARKLGISVKAVEKRMHYALNYLREHINYKI
jgi:RNA polymerase sigma-70 factor (ECF subfamily)